MFKIKKVSKKSKARTGALKTPHGVIQSPFFMPIATKAAVKHLSTLDLNQIGAQIILSNTYHLYLRPTEKMIKKLGGLHEFMKWSGPILTDSGGYQVFSLGGNKAQKENLVKITDDGVHFRSHIDGSKHFFTPEKSIQIQQDLGTDIMMCFDVVPALPATDETIKQSIRLTTEWGLRCYKQWQRIKSSKSKQLLFGIVQGGTDLNFRKQSAEELSAIPFSGYAIGGLAVGEPRKEMYHVLEKINEMLPLDKPRYLMGVGKPEEIVTAVKNGVDMFDCVIPTREARHGRLYEYCPKSSKGAIHLFGKEYYRTINMSNAAYQSDKAKLNPKSANPLLRTHTRAYLYHLLRMEEGLGQRLATLQNVEFYLTLMKKIRLEISAGKL